MAGAHTRGSNGTFRLELSSHGDEIQEEVVLRKFKFWTFSVCKRIYASYSPRRHSHTFNYTYTYNNSDSHDEKSVEDVGLTSRCWSCNTKSLSGGQYGSGCWSMKFFCENCWAHWHRDSVQMSRTLFVLQYP